MEEAEEVEEEQGEKVKEKKPIEETPSPIKNLTPRRSIRLTRSSRRFISSTSSVSEPPTPSTTGTISLQEENIIHSPKAPSSDCEIISVTSPSRPTRLSSISLPPRSKYCTPTIEDIVQEDTLISAMSSFNVSSPPLSRNKSKKNGPGHPMEVMYPYVHFTWFDEDSSVKDSIHIHLPKPDVSKKTTVTVVDDGFGLSITWQLAGFFWDPVRLQMLDNEISPLNGMVTAMKKAGKQLLVRHGSQGSIYATMHIPLEEEVLEKVVSSEIIDFPVQHVDGEVDMYTFHLIELKRKEEPSPLTKISTSGRKLKPLVLMSDGKNSPIKSLNM